jgi:hypothetical protein
MSEKKSETAVEEKSVGTEQPAKATSKEKPQVCRMISDGVYVYEDAE